MTLTVKPWFPWWPGHWRADGAVRMCSLAARGLWREMLDLMHEAEPRGRLLISGVSPTPAQLAAAVGALPAEVEGCLAELEAARVFSRDGHGVIYSRRMVKDSQISQVRSKAGRAGAQKKRGNGAVATANDKQPAELVPIQKPDQTSVSVSVSASKEGGGAGGGAEPFPLPAWQADMDRWMQALGHKGKDRAAVAVKWIDAFDKLVRLDGATPEEISTVVDFVLKDDIPPARRGPSAPGRRPWAGWFSNCRSPMKLRQRNGDGERYFKVLLRHAQQRAPKKLQADPSSYKREDDVDPWGDDDE